MNAFRSNQNSEKHVRVFETYDVLVDLTFVRNKEAVKLRSTRRRLVKSTNATAQNVARLAGKGAQDTGRLYCYGNT